VIGIYDQVQTIAVTLHLNIADGSVGGYLNGAVYKTSMLLIDSHVSEDNITGITNALPE
jgi:hypothetical protein